MKKRNIIIVIAIIVSLCLIILGVNYLKKLPTYKLNVPTVENVSQIELTKNKNTNELTTNYELNEFTNIFRSIKKSTHTESIQDFPRDAKNMITINFEKTNNSETKNFITQYVYEKNNKYYLEQPYNGIYSITKETYEKFQKLYNDINQITCLANQANAYIMTEKNELKKMPISSFNTDNDTFMHYTSAYTDKENIYTIVKTYELDDLRKIDAYFSSNFDIYQTYFINDGVYVYVHNKLNDLNFQELNQCKNSIEFDETDMKKIDSKVIDSLNDTNKIVVKAGGNKLGVINNKKAINEILNIIADAKHYGGGFLCDGHSYDLEMYVNDKLIDNIFVWRDGSRLIPESIHSGCGYYSVNNSKIIEIIERETDYIDYNLYSLTDTCDDNELIYSDKSANYYLNCKERGKMLIEFNTSHRKMNLKYALANNYIKIEYLFDYNNIIIKEEK